jgi:hypothetical protein
VDAQEKIEASAKKYRCSRKGKSMTAAANRRYSRKTDRINVYFTGEDRLIYEIIQKNKENRSYSEIVISALREMILRDL